MTEGKARPGVILYFDSIRPAIKRMSDAQCGVLLRSILDYAEHGALPDETLDPMVIMIFEMLLPKIDRDGERFEETKEQRRYAVYCREEKKKGCEPISFEEWKDNKSVIIEPISTDNGRYPTTTITPTKSPTTTITPIKSPTGEQEEEEKGCKGKAEGETKEQEWERLRSEALRKIGF